MGILQFRANFAFLGKVGRPLRGRRWRLRKEIFGRSRRPPRHQFFFRSRVRERSVPDWRFGLPCGAARRKEGTEAGRLCHYGAMPLAVGGRRSDMFFHRRERSRMKSGMLHGVCAERRRSGIWEGKPGFTTEARRHRAGVLRGFSIREICEIRGSRVSFPALCASVKFFVGIPLLGPLDSICPTLWFKVAGRLK